MKVSNNSSALPITKEKILEARERIRPYIFRTPVLTSDAINRMAGASLWFKCENLQKVGAFKSRGAMNAALSLDPAALAKGLATHSSGNHAQALARAASILGTRAYIVMPRNAPEIKKKGVSEWGGEIFECEPTLQARETLLAEVIQKTGATEIHPFNNLEVIAGQATAALELMEEIPGLDLFITPVGGGGLLSGTALAVHYFAPSASTLAAEPEGADDAFRSIQSGKIELSQSNTIADGLLTTLGSLTFPIIQQLVSGILTVSDEEIAKAMKIAWEKLKIIVEPSGVVPLAAVLKNPDIFRGKKTGLIFSGGNVDLEKALRLIQNNG